MSELLDKLEARSKKVKSIISYLDKNLNTREYNSSYVEEDDSSDISSSFQISQSFCIRAQEIIS